MEGKFSNSIITYDQAGKKLWKSFTNFYLKKYVMDGGTENTHIYYLEKCLELQHGFLAIRIQQLCQCKNWRKKPWETHRISVWRKEKEVFLQVQLEPRKYSSENMIVRVCIDYFSMTFTVMFYICIEKKGDFNNCQR